MSNETLLETPPSSVDDGALASALDVAPPSRRSVGATRVLIGLLLVALGATGGIWWAHRTTSATPNRAAFGGSLPTGALPSGFPAGAGTATGAGAGAGAGTGSSTGAGTSTTTGTVKLVDGSTLYVATSDGKVVKVKTGTGTTVSKATSLADVKAGATVSVTGTTGSDGSVAATAVTERSAQ